MEASKRSKLTAEGLEQLQQGVSLEFSRWWILQEAVSQGWGGPYSREKEASFLASVLGFFSQPKSNEPLYIDDLEDLLYDGMDSMNIIYNKAGEVEEVAEKLMIMHEECLEGNYQSVQRLKEVSPIPHVVQASMGGKDDSVGNDLRIDVNGNMMIDSPANNEAATKDMEVDGWVTVSRKKSKGRKK